MAEFIGRPNFGPASSLWEKAIQLVAQRSNPMAQEMDAGISQFQQGIGMLNQYAMQDMAAKNAAAAAQKANLADMTAKGMISPMVAQESAQPTGYWPDVGTAKPPTMVLPKGGTMTTDQYAAMLGQKPIGPTMAITPPSDKLAEDAAKNMVRVTPGIRAAFDTLKMPLSPETNIIPKSIYEQAMASLNPKDTLGGKVQVTEEDIKSNVKAMIDQGMPPSLIGGGMGQTRAITNAAYQREREKNKNLLTVPQLEVIFSAEKKRAATLNSQQTQNNLIAIQQFNGAVDQALDLSNKIPRGRFIPLNKWTQKMGSEVLVTDPEYAKNISTLKALVVEIANQGSQVFSGTAQTDIKFRQDIERFNSAQTPEMFESIGKSLRQIANIRGQGIIAMPTYLPQSMNIPGTPQFNGGAAQAAIAPQAPTPIKTTRKLRDGTSVNVISLDNGKTWNLE